MKPTVYVVSGDQVELLAIREKLQVCRGYTLMMAVRGSSVIHQLSQDAPDLLVCSFPLEDLGHAMFLRQVRQLSDCPMLAIRDRRISASDLELVSTANSVILEKPYQWADLFDAVDGLLGRSTQVENRFTLGDVEVDRETGQLRREGKIIELSWRCQELLRFLMLHVDQVVPRQQILQKAWRLPLNHPARSVDQCIMRLRRLIETSPKHPQHIVTVRGRGYKLVRHENPES